MSLFLKRLLFFLLPILFLLFLAEFAVREIPNSYKLKANYIKNNPVDIETLILGSSHTFYGVNPSYFSSSAFNAGNISQSPDVDYAILKSHENILENLKIIIIRLSYDTLFEQLKNSPEDWRLTNYRLYTNVDFDYTFKHNSELLSTGTRQAFKTLIAYYIKDKPLLNCDNLGWGNDLIDKPKTNLDDVGIKVAKKHTAKNWDLLDDNIIMFNEIMKWSKKRNVKVLLITPPAYKSYTNNLNEKQLNKMIAVGTNLDSKFQNCTYLNFLEHNDFIASDFYDADHLNAEGAKKFSIIINGLIEN